jgi:hypothetical protein
MNALIIAEITQNSFSWAAFAAILISVGTFSVAALQYFIARERLRLDLFDKRYQVYKYVLKMVHSGKFTEPKDVASEMHEFVLDEEHVLFLFGKDTKEYIEMILKRLFDHLALVHAKADTPKESEEYMKKVNQITESQRWFTYEYPKVRNHFNKYLDFSNVGIRK